MSYEKCFYTTNHSTCTIRYYNRQVDEANIMESTAGNRSVEGVRACK